MGSGGEVEEGGEVGEMMMMKKQCRICHEYGDEGGEMDVPCACNGTIKFAHKICIQKWCNIKGDIVCEICNQVYTPNYIVQPIRSTPDAVTIDIDNSATHQELFYEEYAAANNTGTAWRFIAFIVMVIFFMQNLLMAAKECGLVKEPSQHFNKFLQLAGLTLPCYIIAQSCYMLQSHRRQQHMF